MNQEAINRIAKQLAKLVEDELTEATPEDTRKAECFDEFREDLKRIIEQEESLVPIFKEENLNFTALEHEGFRRGLKYALNMAKNWLGESHD
jgi:hypothetical protein